LFPLLIFYYFFLQLIIGGLNSFQLILFLSLCFFFFLSLFLHFNFIVLRGPSDFLFYFFILQRIYFFSLADSWLLHLFVSARLPQCLIIFNFSLLSWQWFVKTIYTNLLIARCWPNHHSWNILMRLWMFECGPGVAKSSKLTDSRHYSITYINTIIVDE